MITDSEANLEICNRYMYSSTEAIILKQYSQI
jgi:hypothetical protein